MSETARRIVCAAARIAGDEEWEKRGAAVEGTAARIKSGETAVGGPTLAEIMDDNVVKQLAKFLRLHSGYGGPPHRGETHSAQLVELAKDIETFVTPDDDVYATITTKGHRETWPVHSKKVSQYLKGRYFRRYGKIPRADALSDCLGLLEARAHEAGIVKVVFLRVAEDGGAIYLDLGDDRSRSVRITIDGWEVIEDPPVKFRRPRGMLALPEPVRGGRLEELRPFLNAREDATWTLVVSWLLACFRAKGPYPILAIYGEQGSAKSTTARVLRRLIDPNKAELRSQPRDERDLAIAANNQHVVAFDNLSYINHWLSDALCRLATGGSLATRKLYTDDEEMLFDYQRPCLINGIEELVVRSDLLDRTIMITLASIPPESRRPEKEFWAAFEEARPRILGALLDVVAAALRMLPTVKLSASPRMADFALWATAVERAVGWQEGEFMRAYGCNQDEGHRLALEASPVGKAVIELLEQKGGHWRGTATDLLMLLGADGNPRTRSRDWPRNGRALSGALRRLSPNFMAEGIMVSFTRPDRNTREIVLRRTELRR